MFSIRKQQPYHKSLPFVSPTVAGYLHNYPSFAATDIINQ